MLRHRVISSMVGIPLILYSVWSGGWLLLILTAAIMFIGIREFAAMTRKMQLNPLPAVMQAGVLILLAGAYFYGEKGLTWATTLAVAVILLIVVIRYPSHTLQDGAVSILGVIYTGLFVYVYLLRTVPQGWIWLLFMLLATWACDTSAYFTGKKFGRRKLAPLLSPGKTVAGAIGGVAGSLATGVVFYLIHPSLPVTHLLVMGFLVGVAAQLGDLWESVIKRTADIKDTGNIIPGHGGILDRFDSMFFTAPFVYYYLALFKIS